MRLVVCKLVLVLLDCRIFSREKEKMLVFTFCCVKGTSVWRAWSFLRGKGGSSCCLTCGGRKHEEKYKDGAWAESEKCTFQKFSESWAGHRTEGRNRGLIASLQRPVGDNRPVACLSSLLPGHVPKPTHGMNTGKCAQRNKGRLGWESGIYTICAAVPLIFFPEEE
jgi:hypothetical protein